MANVLGCMQCKLTHKQKHTNYKKLTKFIRLYNINCTIVHKLSLNGLFIGKQQLHKHVA